jgi:PAS domain S-box-containing protein
MLFLLFLMIACCAAVGSAMLVFLYKAAFREQKMRLTEVAQSQARTMETVAVHDQKFVDSYIEKGELRSSPFEITLGQFREANRRFKGFGRTGEYTLGMNEGNNIVFLLSHKHKGMGDRSRIPFDSGYAEPMQLALQGKSGVIVGKDYRGAVVLAAHEPVRMPGGRMLGVVAKIDMTEIRAPFVRAGLLGGAICFIAVAAGALAFVRIGRPVLDQLEKYARELEEEIEEREAQQEELARSEHRFRVIFETAASMITSVNAQGVIVDCNGRARDLLGYEREELIGQPMGKIIHPDTLARAQESLKTILSTGSASDKEYRMVRKDGTEIDVSINSSGAGPNEQGFERTICLIEDITDRKRAERALRDSEARFRELTESLRDVFFAMDRSMKITYWNKAAHAFTGIAPEQAHGRLVQDLFPPDTSLSDEDLYRSVMDNRESRRINTFYNSRVLDMSVYPSSHGLSVFVRDITAQKQIEEESRKYLAQLRQSQKLEAVGQMAGGMAHDFNNMLTVILSSAEFALMSLPAEHPVTPDLKEILRACERSRDLTMKLLTFARKDKINVRTVPIAEVIDELVAMLDRSLPKKIQIKTILNHELAVHVDANQIQQALLNVCNNAADAMPEGGDLVIECNDVHFDSQLCPTCGKPLKPRYCQIQITDTGPGIPADLIQKVVEPFFTTKEIGKGTGLGLSVSLGIIENHEGHLHIYSEPGRGTCVRIYIPFAEDAETQQAREPDLTMLRGTETVLVVDDEESVLKAASRLLSSAGYAVLLAGGGAAAMELYERHESDIKAVLLDLIMPEMDGSDVFHELKRRGSQAKIILCSGYSMNGQAGELISMGVDGFLQKPFSAESLLKALRNALNA